MAEESDKQTALPGVMETVDVSFTRARAIHVASHLKPILLKHVLRDREGRHLCRLAGSLRRRVRHIHDLDLVACVSRTSDDLMAPESSPKSRLKPDIEAKGGEVISWGPHHALFLFEGRPRRPLLHKTGSFCRRASDRKR